MPESFASGAHYIKLGPRGIWEAESLCNSVLRLGYPKSPHDRCLAGDWHAVRAAMHGVRGNKGVATRDVGQIRTFYEADAKQIFIAFVGGLLFWCRPGGPPERLEDGSRSRPTLDGWHGASLSGAVLTSDRLSNNLLNLRMFRGTICNVKAMADLERVIDG